MIERVRLGPASSGAMSLPDSAESQIICSACSASTFLLPGVMFSPLHSVHGPLSMFAIFTDTATAFLLLTT